MCRDTPAHVDRRRYQDDHPAVSRFPMKRAALSVHRCSTPGRLAAHVRRGTFLRGYASSLARAPMTEQVQSSSCVSQHIAISITNISDTYAFAQRAKNPVICPLWHRRAEEGRDRATTAGNKVSRDDCLRRAAPEGAVAGEQQAQTPAGRFNARQRGADGSAVAKTVCPRARRDAVRTLVTERAIGVTRTCGMVGMSRSLFHYESRVESTTRR